jgi:hypothetical protein
MSKNALKEAIAEAKILRATAIENAKLALEETFTPKIQSMLSAKLNEEEDIFEEEIFEDESFENENIHDQDVSDEELDALLAELELSETGHSVEEELDEEIDIDSIIQEVEEADKSKKDDKKEDKDNKKEDKKDDKKDAKKDEEELDLENMTLSDLKSLISDTIAEIQSEEEQVGDEMKFNDMEPEGPTMNMGMEDEEEVSLDEILSELDDLDKDDDKDIVKEIENLKQELQEVNLLNSKLLYASKLFLNSNLNESQKLKIVDTFDKASTVKETKLVYETLKESIVAKPANNKRNISEGLGFASKPIGSARKPIIEVDATVARMQKLAGL